MKCQTNWLICMKKNILAIFAFLSIALITVPNVNAAPLIGRDFGFGIILGDPTGGTLKFWTGNTNAVAVSFGNSYYGKFRIGGDYLWHINAFRSNIVNLHAGVGGVIGIGRNNDSWYYTRNKKNWYYDEEKDLNLGIRGVFGINVIPRNTPLEMFAEFGLLMGFQPAVGSAAEAAIGIRFYP